MKNRVMISGVLILCLVFFITGCQSKQYDMAAFSDLIDMELVDIQQLENSQNVIVRIRNNAENKLMDPHVYVSVPVKTSETSYQINKFEVEIKDIPLVIDPLEEIQVSVVIDNVLDADIVYEGCVQYRITGYQETVKNEMRFEKSGGWVKE